MLFGTKFSGNEEIITETEFSFEARESSYYKSDIKKLEGCYNRCIPSNVKYVVVYKIIKSNIAITCILSLQG